MNASYTAKLTYKLTKGQTLSATSTFKGTGEFACQYNPNEYTLMSVSSVSCTRGSTYKYPSSTLTRTLPAFDTIESITYTISGTTPKTLTFVNSAGTQVTLGTTSGTCTTAQVNAIAALGSKGSLKLVETAQLRVLGPTSTSTSVTSGWSPRYLYETGEIGDEKTRSVSKSESNSEYDSYTTTVVITVNYSIDSPEPPGPTPGPEKPTPAPYDYPGYSFVIEKGGVAIGNPITTTETNQLFNCAVETHVANNKLNMYAAKMNVDNSNGWNDCTLNDTNATVGQSTVGQVLGVKWRREANGRIVIAGNVKFTAGSSYINIAVIPEEICPSNTQIKFINMSTIANDIGAVRVTAAGNVDIMWVRNNNSSSAITTTFQYSDFCITYFI